MRRPHFEKIPNLGRAVGTLACYFKNNLDGLHARLPLVSWCPALWKGAPTADIYARLAAKRRGIDAIQIDLVPRNVRICKEEVPATPSQANENSQTGTTAVTESPSQQINKCAFGCKVTATKRMGICNGEWYPTHPHGKASTQGSESAGDATTQVEP